MLFNKIIQENIDNLNNPKLNKRKAVRAIIFNESNDKILLINTNLGDYKFPGGGIKKNESDNDALKREVKEETGFVVTGKIDLIGKITERGPDSFEENAIFEMESFYYLCKISNDIKQEQNLEDYEKELEFKPVFIPIEDAITKNEELLAKNKNNNTKINFWVNRETVILKAIKVLINKGLVLLK